MTLPDILLAAVAIGFGGFLKGATGAGAPVVGVPILALIFDVQTAVAVFAVLNLLSNFWLAWSYRVHQGNAQFVWSFAIAGAIGAILGSVLLATLPTDLLLGGLATVVFLYIALRLAKSDWILPRSTATRYAPIAGAVGGLMQGAGGISAPVSVTFLNAMRLERLEFIATISVFFTAMSVTQVPSQALLGILTWDRLFLAGIAALPLFAMMPVGEWAARYLSKDLFDRVILALLAVIAVRLAWVALT